MKEILIIAAIALVFLAFLKYLFGEWHFKNAERRIPSAYIQEWEIFIRASIHSCYTLEQADRCFELIELFDRWFIGSVPEDSLNSTLDKLYNRLKQKVAAIKSEEKEFGGLLTG